MASREEIIEECAAVADAEVRKLVLESNEYKRIGDLEKMYKTNCAYHAAACIAESIRYLKTYTLSEIVDGE